MNEPTIWAEAVPINDIKLIESWSVLLPEWTAFRRWITIHEALDEIWLQFWPKTSSEESQDLLFRLQRIVKIAHLYGDQKNTRISTALKTFDDLHPDLQDKVTDTLSWERDCRTLLDLYVLGLDNLKYIISNELALQSVYNSTVRILHQMAENIVDENNWKGLIDSGVDDSYHSHIHHHRTSRFGWAAVWVAVWMILSQIENKKNYIEFNGEKFSHDVKWIFVERIAPPTKPNADEIIGELTVSEWNTAPEPETPHTKK